VAVFSVVYNYGRATASSIAADALSPSWSWGMTDHGEVFPGGSTSVVVNGVTYDHCPPELEPGGVCVLSLLFSPTEIGCSPFDLRLAYTSMTNRRDRSMHVFACGSQPEG